MAVVARVETQVSRRAREVEVGRRGLEAGAAEDADETG